jgi:hypothetical protein
MEDNRMNGSLKCQRCKTEGHWVLFPHGLYEKGVCLECREKLGIDSDGVKTSRSRGCDMAAIKENARNRRKLLEEHISKATKVEKNKQLVEYIESKGFDVDVRMIRRDLTDIGYKRCRVGSWVKWVKREV